ncbi:MAG: hypothetical protein V4637_16285, partial [Pseudomonadota bacterium]
MTAKKKAVKRIKPDPRNLTIENNSVMQGGMPQALGMRVISLTRKKVVGEMVINQSMLNRLARNKQGANNSVELEQALADGRADLAVHS